MEQRYRKSNSIRGKSAENVPTESNPRDDRSYGPEGQEFESLTACQTAPKSADFGAVFVFFGTFHGVLICVDPYRDPYGSWEGKGLKRSGEKGANFFGCVLFHCRGDMAVCVEGESSGVVAEETGEGLYVHAVLQCHGCEGVPQGMEADFFEACPFENTVEHFQDTVR